MNSIEMGVKQFMKMGLECTIVPSESLSFCISYLSIGDCDGEEKMAKPFVNTL